MNLVSRRIRTGSRLHLGLLSLPGAAGRQFGGVGLMIDEPAVTVFAEPADAWSATGPLAERAIEWARLASDRPCRVVVERCPPQHIGLGVGTQLALATAAAVSEETDATVLAARIGRGLRSGIGVHGFAGGGFLVDGGKGPATTVAPLVSRVPFPEDWRILLATPRGGAGLAGAHERTAFAQLSGRPAESAATDALCRLVLLEMIPALVERDLTAFGDAVFEFNRRSGLAFKDVQGGEYASPAAAQLVASLRAFGLRGVGQSSWGPTLFGIGDQETANAAASRLGAQSPHLDVHVVTARNRGAEWES